MDVRSRSKSNRRRGRETASGDGVDRISNLTDDLLVRILELLPDTRDAVRTHALSRRWRGLWTGVPALRFDFNYGSRPAAVYREAASAAERYIAFINNTLAFRAAAEAQPTTPAVKDLAISFDVRLSKTGRRLVPVSVAAAAQGWIRYAAQQEVKSFVLKLELSCGGDDDIGNTVMTLDEADNISAKMESLHLGLGSMQLRLPSSPTVVFASLTNLSLDNIKLPAGGGHLLSRLVSSACCPNLHVLQLACLELSTMEGLLIIEADALLELSLEAIYELRFLEIRTPILRVLRMEDCFNLYGFTVSAPKLEDLMVWIQQPLEIGDVHGHLARVETVKIQLFSHGDFSDDAERNDVNVHLLQYCRLTKHFEVSFHVEMFYHRKEQTNDIITGRIPQLPHVTSLAARVELPERHLSGPGVGCLLAQCSNVKYLSLHLCYFTSIKQKDHTELDLLCDNLCHWKSHKFSLAHLQEVEFKNLIGTNCEFQFIQSTLARATKIQKVTISFDRCRQKDSNNAFELMPAIDGGSWTNCDDANVSFLWRRRVIVHK